MTTSASEFTEPPAFSPAESESPSAIPERLQGRVLVMVTIMSTFLLSANALVCATLSHFFGLPGWSFWQAVPGSLAVAFIATTILGFRYSNPLLRTIYTVSATWLAALNYAFFASIACWLVDGAARLAGLNLPRFDIAVVLFAIALLTTLYGLINAASLRVTRVVVPLPNLPEAWAGRTMALLTDLHLGHLSGPGFLRRILSRLRSLQPDAVLISGDLFDGTPIGLDRLVAPWHRFSPPRGIFYVTGNHDEFAERRIYLDAVKRTGIRVLNNEKVSLDGLQIVGVHDSEAGDPDQLRDILRRAELDPQRPSILLAHQPANLAVAEEEGISLQLSGHTHGGQFWPWIFFVSRIYGPFAYGLSRLGKLLVFTSNGVGTWGPPVRVGTKSEIVLFRFVREMAAS
ncbi:MAG TPA: metallophosphoesterase [Chthoniobacter sp.]|nr:metallophosphoesterase [Chthoniobacter sp.]